MGDSSTAPDGGRRRPLGTTRRKVIAAALYIVVVLAAVGIVILVRSGAPSASGASAGDRDYLYGVSCVSPRFCVSVGAYRANNGYQQSLIESWNGTRWSIAPSADAGTTDELHGVSCVSPRFCVSVGAYRVGSGRDRSLVESWDGSRWSIVPSPNTSDYDGDFLASVSCASGSFCAAVGRYTSASTHRPRALVESWDGSRWSIAPSAQAPADVSDIFASVSCTSGSACTAVGDYVSPSTRPLAERWNGAQWSIAAAPGVPPGGSAYTSSVSCAESNSCVAIGYYQGHGVGRAQPTLVPLAESLDGTRWSTSTDAAPHADGMARFFGVSCAGTSDCMATGWSRPTAKTVHTLVESWDGAKWSTAASPSTASGNDGLLSVSCMPRFCAAVGYSTSPGHARTLIELWNGARWSIAASPNE